MSNEPRAPWPTLDEREMSKHALMLAEIVRLKPSSQPQNYSLSALVNWCNEWHEHDERWNQYLLSLIQSQEKTEMASLADLAAQVAAEKTVDASIITLVNGLAATIAGIKGQTNLSPADQAVLDQAVSDLKGEAGNLAAAVTANTPAAP